MKRPTDEHLEMAIMWLEDNEGEDEEKAAMESVAAFLKEQLRLSIVDQLSRKIKIDGVSKKDIRKKLNAKSDEELLLLRGVRP